MAFRALPAQLCHPSRTNFKEAAIFFSVFVAEVQHKWGDVVGLQGLDHVLRHDGLCHARASERSNGVDVDVARFAFARQRVAQAKDAELHGRVVRLAKVAINAGSRGHIHDAAEALLPHDRPGSLGNLVSSLEVHLVNEVPILVRHLGKRGVTEDTGVVDNNIDAPVSVHGGLDDLVAIHNGVVVGYGLATLGADFVHDLLCRSRRAATFAVE
mmetsp:Transcript_24549/g.35998  ORF Transcript_24549/g.35998 Transcript_24549/m.35998 type:complete len:213 (-) Transcript_24549:198-836(-)